MGISPLEEVYDITGISPIHERIEKEEYSGRIPTKREKRVLTSE